MVVRGSIDEVVRQVGTGLAQRLDVVDRQVQLLERETTRLADHARYEVVRCFRQRMPLGPRREALCALLDTEETIRVEAEATHSQVGERMECITNYKAHTRERGVKPVDGRLTGLEVMKVGPATYDAVHAPYGCGHTPVRLLDARLVKDDSLEAADDAASLLKPRLCVRVEVHRVLTWRHVREDVPLLLGDRKHVIDPRVVTVGKFGESEIGAFAGVAGNDVVDHRPPVLGSR